MKNIQESMFGEIQNKTLLDRAHQYASAYLEEVFDRDVYPSDEALKALSQFEEPLPQKNTNAEDVIDLLHKVGSPATVATLGGRYFGFVTGSALPVTLAAKTLSTVWDQAPAMNVLSPIGSKLESVVEGWLCDLFNLPENSAAGFVSGTSLANVCGLASARFHQLKKLGWDVNQKGLNGSPKLRLITSKQSHSTVHKAISLLGLGYDNIEWVGVDDQGRILEDQLPELDESCVLILQAGNVNTGSFDGFDTLCKKAREKGCWIHIDGAFGLWAAATTQLNHLTKGMGHADSWAVDGHKTLNTPYDCGIILCRNKEALNSALHMSGSYLVLGEERNGMFYTPEMSRRARIIELWAALKYLGKEGIDQLVYGMHERAAQFGQEIGKIDGFEVLNDVVFNQVLLKCNTDELTLRTMHNVQDLRECWAGGSQWNGEKVIRISVCSWATTKEDISRSVKSFERALHQVNKVLKE